MKLHGFHDDPYDSKEWPLIFLHFFSHFKGFTRIDEYANLIILISDNWVKAICLSINLVPSLVSQDSKRLRYM